MLILGYDDLAFTIFIRFLVLFPVLHIVPEANIK